MELDLDTPSLIYFEGVELKLLSVQPFSHFGGRYYFVYCTGQIQLPNLDKGSRVDSVSQIALTYIS